MPDPIVNTATVSSPTLDPGTRQQHGHRGGQPRCAGRRPAGHEDRRPDAGGGGHAAHVHDHDHQPWPERLPAMPGATVSDRIPGGAADPQWTSFRTSPVVAAAQRAGRAASRPRWGCPRTRTVTLTVTGTVAPDFLGAADQHGAVTNPPASSRPTIRRRPTSPTWWRVADLSVSKTGPPVVVPSNQVVYTIVVSNPLGGSTAQNVQVTDQTPPGLTFVSNTGACTTAFPCAWARWRPARHAPSWRRSPCRKDMRPPIRS